MKVVVVQQASTHQEVARVQLQHVLPVGITSFFFFDLADQMNKREKEHFVKWLKKQHTSFFFYLMVHYVKTNIYK